jgi:hypothetical protein
MVPTAASTAPWWIPMPSTFMIDQRGPLIHPALGTTEAPALP